MSKPIVTLLRTRLVNKIILMKININITHTYVTHEYKNNLFQAYLNSDLVVLHLLTFVINICTFSIHLDG